MCPGKQCPDCRQEILASSLDALPPWYWLLTQPETFEGLSGRGFRAGERQLERRERQGRGNAHLQTIDVAFGGQSDPKRGGQEVHGQPFALPELNIRKQCWAAAGEYERSQVCLFYKRSLCVRGVVGCGVV